MKFNCDRCGKKYSISDDKLQNYGSTFKIRCQDCKHIIIIANPIQTEAVVPKEWYAYIKSKQTGPLSIDEISEFIQNGEITFATLVWKNGMADWQQAQFIPELKNSLKLPIRTPERRASQTKMLSQIYNEAKTSNEINPDAFDEGEKTVTFSQDEMNEKMNVVKNKEMPPQKQETNIPIKQEEIKKQIPEFEQQNEPQIDVEEKEEDETSVSADDFFKKDFEEKKQDKDTKLLRSITGDNTFGNTGIFVMYTQKQRKMKYLFIGILSFVLLVSAGIIYYFVTKEPTIVEKETVIEKVVEKEKIIQGEDKIVYVEVNKNNTKSNVTSNKTTNTTDTSNTTDTKTNVDLYGLKTTDTSKVALNVKDDSVYKSESKDKDYVQAVANSVEEKKQGVMTCFQTELKTNPELKAKVQFKLNISSSGRVNDVTAEFAPKSLNESILSDCMTKKIKSWKFPENPDGGATEFSFKLALQGQ